MDIKLFPFVLARFLDFFSRSFLLKQPHAPIDLGSSSPRRGQMSRANAMLAPCYFLSSFKPIVPFRFRLPFLRILSLLCACKVSLHPFSLIHCLSLLEHQGTRSLSFDVTSGGGCAWLLRETVVRPLFVRYPRCVVCKPPPRRSAVSPWPGAAIPVPSAERRELRVCFTCRRRPRRRSA